MIWPKSRKPTGHGQTYKNGKVVYAHRVAWEEANGPIPDGMCVHHRCETPACVNVAHMELLRRDDHAGALGHGKLTRAQASEIRALLAAGWSQRWTAAAYGVSQALCIKIKRGQCWAAA